MALGVGFVGNYAWLKRSKTIDPETVETQGRLLRDSIKGFSFVAIALVGVLFVAIPIYMAYLEPSVARSTIIC